MQELRETVATTIADLSDRRSLTERQYEYLQECTGLEHKLRNAIASIGDSEWVVQAIYGGGGVELKPLYVSTEIADTLFTLADKFVLMSATIIDVDQFCKSVGIPAKDCVFITMDSPFPITSRPIVHYDVGSLSQKNFDANGQYMIEAIEYLLKKHAGQKGIIHTHSDKLARYIQDNLDDERLLYKDGNVTAMLDEHNVRTDSVIVASGLSEGLDLKDDLARFCIICKVPYPSLGDVQIKRRMELDRKYYTYLTCLKIVQEYGRTIRTGADWSSTYILDGDFNRLPDSMLPQWFLEAVVSEEDADEGLTLTKKVI